jgi:hypothetical protein
MIELVGWISSAMLTLCAVPLAWRAMAGRPDHINPWTMGLWLGGEVFGLVYTFSTRDWPLVFNYAANLVCLLLYFVGRARSWQPYQLTVIDGKKEKR